MTRDEFDLQFPKSKRLTSYDYWHLNIHDNLVYWHPIYNCVVKLRVSEIGNIHTFVAYVIDCPIHALLYTFQKYGFDDYTFFFVGKEVEGKPKSCSCGARFTSMPKYHLAWCDMNLKE